MRDLHISWEDHDEIPFPAQTGAPAVWPAAGRAEGPFSGVIARRNVEPYQEVKAGEALFTLMGDSGLKVIIQVPAPLIGSVKQGEETVVSFPALKGEAITGRIMANLEYTNTDFIKLSLKPTNEIVSLTSGAGLQSLAESCEAYE
jgi:hypothetical protein